LLNTFLIYTGGDMNARFHQLSVRLLAVAGLALAFACANDAEISAGKSDGVKVTSKQLAAEYVKNQAAAEKKYGDRYAPKEITVEGVVVRFAKSKFGKVAQLEGDGKVTVSCLLRAENEASVKQGESVTIRGKCRGLFEDKKDSLIDINGGVVVKAK